MCIRDRLLQFIRASESEQAVHELLGNYPEKFSRLDSETVAAICLFTGIEIACEDEKEVVDLSLIHIYQWFSTNFNVEVHAYVKNGKFCVEMCIRDSL